MSTDRSGGRLRFLDQSDAEAALLRARLDAVTRLAAQTQRTRLDVEREAAQLCISAVTLYKLLRRYSDDPKPESVLELRRGWTKGRSRLIHPEIGHPGRRSGLKVTVKSIRSWSTRPSWSAGRWLPKGDGGPSRRAGACNPRSTPSGAST